MVCGVAQVGVVSDYDLLALDKLGAVKDDRQLFPQADQTWQVRQQGLSRSSSMSAQLSCSHHHCCRHHEPISGSTICIFSTIKQQQSSISISINSSRSSSVTCSVFNSPSSRQGAHCVWLPWLLCVRLTCTACLPPPCVQAFNEVKALLAKSSGKK